jgi:hypothetical protein
MTNTPNSAFLVGTYFLINAQSGLVTLQKEVDFNGAGINKYVLAVTATELQLLYI